MHVPDGFVSPAITLPAYAVAAPLWAWAARRHFGPAASTDALPLVGSLTALAFVIQTILIPVPGGTSTHLVGMTVLAIVQGPLVAFVCESLVLVVQALFFGAGGFTVLGVNALAMGLLGPLAGWAAFRLLARRSERVAAFLGAWLAVVVSTAAVVGVLALQRALSPEYFPMPVPVTALAMLGPAALVTGVVEGLYTAFTLAVLRKARLHGVA